MKIRVHDTRQIQDTNESDDNYAGLWIRPTDEVGTNPFHISLPVSPVSSGGEGRLGGGEAREVRDRCAGWSVDRSIDRSKKG